MISMFALLGTLLLVSSALAVHTTSQSGVSLDHRGDNLQSNEADDDINWTLGFAGSMLTGVTERFHCITATVTIPTLMGSDGFALISMGVDGGACETGSLSIGIQGQISSNVATWSVWCQWLPAPRVDLNGTMEAGNVIFISIFVTYSTRGAVYWENQTTGAKNMYSFNTTYPNYLCMRTVGWGVQALRDTGTTFFPLADFDNVTFTNAMAAAVGSHKTYRPFGAPLYKLYGISQNKAHVTNVSGNGSTLIIQHI